MKCLICEKKIKPIKNIKENPDGAGFIKMSFHYGSRHDGTGIGMFDGPDSVEAYICDDCFDAKKHICIMK